MAKMAIIVGCACAADAEEGRDWERRLLDRLDYSSILEVEWAQELTKGDGQKLELQYYPESDVALPHDLDLTLIGRLRSDLLDELEKGDPGEPEVMGPTRRWVVGDRTELELREAYLDATPGKAFLRVGKQQVVWGTADGLKVLDVVNPQDFREFILDSFEDSRIPLWTLNLEVPIKSVNAQFVWIPDTTVHRLPQRGSAYEVTAGLPEAPPFFRVAIEEPDRPKRVIADSDIGMRLSAFWGGWDLSVVYLYRYDDFPTLTREVSFFPRPNATVTPEHDRTHLVGGTFSNAFGNLAIRGEVGYSFGKLYSTERLLDRDGVFESDEFSYVLGLDWFGFSDTFLSMQLFQNILTNPDDGMLRDQVETNLTFVGRRNFRNETVLFETIVIHNLNDGDGVIRPKISYDMRANMTVWAGFDLFYGTREGTFGQFDRRDRIVFGAEWGF